MINNHIKLAIVFYLCKSDKPWKLKALTACVQAKLKMSHDRIPEKVTIAMALHKLCVDGVVQRVRRGVYALVEVR